MWRNSFRCLRLVFRSANDLWQNAIYPEPDQLRIALL